MKGPKKTFKTIVDQAADSNRLSLMDKARLANQLAKNLKGRQKSQSYEIKIKSLLALLSKFSEKIELRVDWRTPDMVVVKTYNGGGLHLPKSQLRTLPGSTRNSDVTLVKNSKCRS